MNLKQQAYLYTNKILNLLYAAPIKFVDKDKPEVFRLIRSLKQERQFFLRYPEAYNLYRLVQNTAKVAGDIAEIGTFQGASAKLIALAKGKRHLFVFDTFEGLPDTRGLDAPKFRKGQFRSDYQAVKAYLADFADVHVYKGYFPDQNAEVVADRKFSLVHLDVDLYESTCQCLAFFYPRLSPGGCLLTHDYYANGVYQAFHEFFADKPEIIVELPEDQALVVKL